MPNSDANTRAHHPAADRKPPANRKLGPYSRVLSRGAIGSAISGSSWQGRFLRHYEAELTAHVGGRPSIVERLLISRCARLALRLELLDERYIDCDMTERDGRFYLSWERALAASLARLGLKGAPAPKQTLADVLATMRRSAAAPAAAHMMRRLPLPRASPPAGPSVIDVMDAPALLGDMFGGPSWAPWRAFLASLFGLPMSDEQAEIFRQCTGRTAAPTKPFREAALVIGRRGGKSRVLALVAVYLAVFHDCRPYLAPGELPVIAVIAADRRQARIILGYVRGLLLAVDVLADTIEADGAEVLAVNGVNIEISTGSIASPRGRTYAAVLCDEIAFWRSDEGSRNPDAEVLNAVRPGLATIPHSLMLMASMPIRAAWRVMGRVPAALRKG